MGCSLTIIRPEHRVLDSCIEIGRLASLPDEPALTIVSSSSLGSSNSSSKCSSRDLEYFLREEFNLITNISKSCEILPQYCLREVRHAVETLHFKKPEISQRLMKLTESTIATVKQKTLGLSSAYSCLYSPNEGVLKVDFIHLQTNDVSPSRTSLVIPSSPTTTQQLHVDTTLKLLNPSKTPSPPRSPATTPPTPTSPISDSKSPVFSHNEGSRRASCPPPTSPKYSVQSTAKSPIKSETKKYDRHDLELPLSQRPRLRSLDENDQSNYAEYGFFHEDDNISFC